MKQALNRPDEIGARAPFHRRFAGAHFKIAAHAGGQIDDDFLVLGADALHDFLVEIDTAGTLAGFWITDMAMDHCRTGSGGFEGRIGNLLGRYGNIRAFANRVASACHGAGNDDFGIHGVLRLAGRLSLLHVPGLTFFAIELAFYAMTAADVVFHLVPRFSMISLYGALEPLRVANRFAERKFSWRFISADGKPVSASNDIPVSVSGSLADVGRPTMVVVCASYEPEHGITKPALAVMRKLATQKVLLAGIDTGPFLLASAGVLDGYRATCHWESLPGFRESFPRVQAMQSLFEVDRDRLTSAGGSSVIDMMLEWIRQQLGREIAVTVADQLVHSRFAEPPGEARIPAAARYGTTDSRMLSCIALMEEQLEEPRSVEDLANRAGVSVRQLERLFSTTLKKRPMGFYLDLRLERAERLINYSLMSIREVAVATGFSALSQFSRSFKQKFGKSPSKWRKK